MKICKNMNILQEFDYWLTKKLVASNYRYMMDIKHL